MTRSISITPSAEEVSIVCGYLQEDPRAIRGYLGFLQRHTNAESHNFASWVIRHVLVNPPASLKARVAQTATTPLKAVATLPETPTKPSNFTLSFSQPARLKFVREMALFAAETADLEALDYALVFPSTKGRLIDMDDAWELPVDKGTLAASVYALASSSLCGCCRLSTLEHLFAKDRPAQYVLAVILRSLKDKDFVKACFASPTLSDYYTQRSFAIAISAACSGVSTLTIPQRTSAVNAALAPHLLTHTKIAALRKLCNQNIGQVLSLLAHSGDAISVEILLNLDDVHTIRVNMNALVTDGHVEVLRVILDHPKYRHHLDPKKRQDPPQQTAGSGGATATAGNEFVDLSPLIVMAAGTDNVEVLRLLICKAKEYGISIDVRRALRGAIVAENTENVEELLRFLTASTPSVRDEHFDYGAFSQLIGIAIRRDCVAIVSLFIDYNKNEYISANDLIVEGMSLRMLELLGLKERPSEYMSLRAYLLNKPPTASILAAYPRNMWMHLKRWVVV